MPKASLGRPGSAWVVRLALSGIFAAAACSSGSGSGGTPGAGGAGAGGAGGAGAGGAGAGGAAGGSGGAGARSDAGAGGTTGAGGGGAAGGSGGTSGAGGGPADAGTRGTDGGATGGSGGATACGARVLSLSANGTGTDSDAARSRVVADLMTDLPVGNASRTVEFWAFIKTTDWIGERNEVYEYGAAATASTTNTAFGLDFGTNPVTGMAANHATLNPYTNGAFTVDSANYLGITSTMNQWVHIAMTWDGVALRTYVNGTLGITSNGTAGATMLATAQTPLTIGCNDPIFNCFNGEFAEFRVWKVARTAAQIMANYNKPVAGSEPDLVGYWKLDDAPGSATAADSVTAPHTPHPGMLTATSATGLPTFVAPSAALPLLCP
jgi:Concanavalin A-like lectin/glucanases superfamily